MEKLFLGFFQGSLLFLGFHQKSKNISLHLFDKEKFLILTLFLNPNENQRDE